MDELEKQLREALSRKEASPFFEARVLGAVTRQSKERRTSLRMWWASGVAAAALVASGSLWQYEQNVREEARGREAKARLELALKVTSVKLQKISRKVEGI